MFWELAGATGNNGFEGDGSRNGDWLRGLLQVRLCGTIIAQYMLNHKCYINRNGFGSSLAALDLMFLKERGHKMSSEQKSMPYLLFSLIIISSHAENDNTCSTHVTLGAHFWHRKMVLKERGLNKLC